ncbi:MAG TPA: class I SAM-dependent methyltransferase [Fulvivirga sp.]|nr:class I SAM-dependent methyltransferase [Fulvivirga sp.]
MSKKHQLLSYISYWLNEENEHSLHSPFVYELYKKVIIQKNNKPIYPNIEQIRYQFIQSKKVLNVQDFGSGEERSSERKIADIAAKGLSRRKYSELFERLIHFLEAKKIVELGTSLGINTLYLANGNNKEITTFEGDPSLAAIAAAVFEGNDKNVNIIEGNIDKTLPTFLQKKEAFDFVLFDANHRYAPTMDYFNQFLRHKHDTTCFVFDDIHFNEEMESAWAKIKSHYEVTVSIDLFQVGLIFFNPELRKQDYILAF